MRNTLLALVVLAALRAAAVPTQVNIMKVTGTIAVDGDLSDSAWERAQRVEAFVEYFRGDNTAPPAKTVGWLAYDAAAVYVAFRADDPRPDSIRAPLVDRDQVLGDQDYVAILIDTSNDGRAGVAFRVNPRGVQTDSVVNDANGLEDFSPDFFYEAVARRVPGGWTAEMRIPLSSLRYPAADPQQWGVILMRNYPRDFRYIMANTPIPKNSSCFICHAATLTGLEGLPTGSHFTLTPYSTANYTERGAADSQSADLGLDFKWNPSTRLTLDATVNPDFSQIEADVPQSTVNTQFALSYPEKRAFFLESVDLLTSPMQAVYSRTITAPAWGMRATGQLGSTAYTLLVADDRGGGLTILPGTYGSSVKPQAGAHVLIGRARRGIGNSFIGFLATAREGEDDSHNRVFGPDFLWKPNARDRISGQLLLSDTDGASGHAARVHFSRDARRYDLYAVARELSPEFRADSGFIPQVGFRSLYTEAAARMYPKRGLTYLRAYLGRYSAQAVDGGEMIKEELHPGFYFQGKWGSEGWITYRGFERERVGSRVFDYAMTELSVRAAPRRWFPAVQLAGTFGDKIDYAGGRLGDGANLTLSSTLRPTDHLELQGSATREWLDLDGGRLFTATINYVKATYIFTARSLVRLVAQHTDVTRGQTRDQSLTLSGLYAYKLNWQTVFFLGYGDSSITGDRGQLTRDSRSVFMKVAYAFQR